MRIWLDSARANPRNQATIQHVSADSEAGDKACIVE